MTIATQQETLESKINRIGKEVFAQLNGTYRLLIDNEKEVTVVEILEPGVIAAISKKRIVSRELVRQFGNQLTPTKVSNELYPRWLAEMEAGLPTLTFDRVLPFAFKSQRLADEQFAWQRLAFDHDPTAKCPDTFAELLKRTTADEARSLVLFIGSLFDYSFPRSQYMYLWGDGNDGKSMLLATLANMFSLQGVTTMRSGDFADKHSTTTLERARLLIFADQNNNSFMSTGHFKALTGDDVLTINPKNQPRRNIKLNCKVLIASNNPPNLNGGRADERRILPVKFASYEGGADHGFVGRFQADACRIAQYCLAEFAAWKRANPDRDIPPASEAMEVVRTESLEAVANGLVDRWFDFDRTNAEEIITPLELSEKVSELTRTNFALSRQVYGVLAKRGLKRAKAWTDPGKTKRINVWKGAKIHDIVPQKRGDLTLDGQTE